MPNDLSVKQTKKIIAILLCVFVLPMLVLPLCLIVTQLDQAQKQHRMIQSYVPVSATVFTSQVTSQTGSKGQIYYFSEIQYNYEFDGKKYQSGNLMPLVSSGGRDWAQAIVNQYPAGRSCQAYCDPNDPAQAILMRQYSFEPYFLMLLMALILSTGTFVFSQMWFAKRKEPVPGDNGWFEYQAQLSEHQRLLIAKICIAAWYCLGAIPAAHYFLCVPPPYSNRAIHDFIGFALLGLIPLAFLVRYYLICRNLDDARLRIDQAALSPGRPFSFVIVQHVHQQLSAKLIRVRILCVRQTSQGKSSTYTTLYEAIPVELKDHILHAGEDLQLSGKVTLPPNSLLTGREPLEKNCRIHWKIELNCKLVHAPRYNVTFPIEVHAAPPQSSPNPAKLAE